MALKRHDLSQVRTAVRDLPGLALRPVPSALDGGNATIALAAAADLPHVADALELLLLLDSEPSRFERAALRWHGRYCREIRDVDLTEAQAFLACLAGLRGSRPEPAAHALADLVDRRDLARASKILNRWGARVGRRG